MNKKSPAHRAALSKEDYHKLTGFDGDWRDTWWNDEFLSMMSTQWELEEIQSVLDMGCGVGHWGQRLLRYMPQTTTLHGIDPEAEWIKGAKKRALNLKQEERSDFQVGSAENLPWPDNHFDMVTCQTLLIHVAEIRTAIQEMARVLKPGGLFLAAEPNNFGSSAAGFIKNPLTPWEKVSDLLELEYRCMQGKVSLGEGHQSGGHLVLDALRACGWDDVKIHLNNQSARVTPPYTDLASKTMVGFLRTTHESGAAMVLGSTRENCLRYYRAGGGEETRFPKLWQEARTRLAGTIAEINAGTYASAGGHIHYLTWGRKPTV